jgi:hypothetical protein
LNDERHREDGPAFIKPDGTQVWYLNGILHRDDGPTVIHHDGSLEYHAFGIKYNSLEELQIYLVLNS